MQIGTATVIITDSKDTHWVYVNSIRVPIVIFPETILRLKSILQDLAYTMVKEDNEKYIYLCVAGATKISSYCL